MSGVKFLTVLYYSILSSAFLTSMFVFTGCEPFHCYNGPHLTKDKLALVSVGVKESHDDDDENPSSIEITSVDNKIPADYDMNNHGTSFHDFYVLPGFHKFSIEYQGPSSKKILLSIIDDMLSHYDRFNAEVEFYAEASHEYAIHFEENEGWGISEGIVNVNYWVEDVNYCDSIESIFYISYHTNVRCGKRIPSITTRTKDISKTK